jgi:alpha-ketoglutarate-dependent taurine dioxygenase
MRIFFFALVPPEKGGETPIVDSRKVYQSIPPDVRDRFEEKGVMYMRNYGTGIDLSWQEAFQTSEKSQVEEYCRQAPVDWEWLDGDRLRTRQTRPAVARHPDTGELLWFNQAHLFHVSNLEADVRSSMREVFGEQDLPRNAYFGDGTPIPDSDLDAVRAAYHANEVAFPWQKGDVLMLDNMFVAHGRNPYKGARRILAALSQPFNSRNKT